MILSREEAIQIVKDNPNAEAIKYKRNKHLVMKAHVTGIGNDDLITPIKSFEREIYTKSRKAMAMSNKDVIHRVMMPRNKMYTAKGGVETYTLSKPEYQEQFRTFLAECHYKQSLKSYIRQYIQPAFDYDPEGLMWLDEDDYSNPFPTFKSIMQIYDYELTGRIPQYVVFELSAKEAKQIMRRAEAVKVDLQGNLVMPPSAGGKKKTTKVFRCVCDAFDRIIVYDQPGMPVIVSEIPNPFAFMGVPGRIVSDIVAPTTSYEDTCYDSPLAPSLDLLTNLIFGRSLYNVAYARTAYPKEWMQQMPCPRCEGTGQVDALSCPECKGSKYLPFQQHSDVLVVDYSTDHNKSVPTPPMGHVPTDVEALRFMVEHGATIEDLVRSTQWGVLTVRANGTKVAAGHGGNISATAYEAQQNEQPMLDKITEYSFWYSDAMKFYADGCGRFAYGDAYIDSAIMAGDRLMIESADATFDRLLKARQGGATKSELLSLTMEYIENKYARNPIEYRKYKILAVAEPFYHDSISDVLTWDVPEINKLEKIFFDEWQGTLTDEYFATLPDDGLEQIVKDDLRQYTLTRISKDNSADTLIQNAYNGLINIGDVVTVRKRKNMQTNVLGRKLTLKDMVGRYAILTDGENEYTGVEMADLIKQ